MGTKRDGSAITNGSANPFKIPKEVEAGVQDTENKEASGGGYGGGGD